MWHIFSRSIERDKCPFTFQKAHEGWLTFIAQVRKLISIGPMKLLKTQFVKKKANFFSERNSFNSFFGIIEYEKPHRTFYRVQQLVSMFIVLVIGSFLQDLISRKPNFSK